MRFLLDTHTFIWFVTDSPRLSNRVKQLIEDDYNEKLLSPASIWEMAIKHSMGKLNFATPFPQFIEQQIGLNSMDLCNFSITAGKSSANSPQMAQNRWSNTKLPAVIE